MFFRRALIPIAMVLTMLVQFLPGSAMGPKPVAAALCDSAQFIDDVTIPDGTGIAPGASFVKTWRLKNNGTCTWTADYAIVFDSGDSLGAPAAQKLGSAVVPGQTIDVSVTLRAPAKTGSYKGNWKMRNAAGVLFGLGSGLGYAGVGQSIAVKFDINSNAGEGSSSTGLYINGASPTSYFSLTTGCNSPRTPITCPLTFTSAALPGCR